MVNKKQLYEEVEKILEAYDEDIILEANPFLLTRVKTVREQRSAARGSKTSFRLNFSRAFVLMLLIINVITIVYYLENNSKHNLQKKLVMQLKTDFQIDQTQNNF